MKPSTMSNEVREMIDLRRGAEQRGQFEPIGRLQCIQTEHGTILFPAVNGEGCGPDLARWRNDDPTQMAVGSDPNALIVLGHWQGLPALRVNSTKPCLKCRATCDVCRGEGKKLCERCGGQTWLRGPWVPCSGAGCNAETGRFNPGCETCHGTGQIAAQIPCDMCEASGRMNCSRCHGSKKYSTGHMGGSEDFETAKKCKACGGTCFQGKWIPQNLEKFTNAVLEQFLVLGPIRELVIRDCYSLSSRGLDVSPDEHGDSLVLLVPRSRRQRPYKAYLVGGIVRERSGERRLA